MDGASPIELIIDAADGALRPEVEREIIGAFGALIFDALLGEEGGAFIAAEHARVKARRPYAWLNAWLRIGLAILGDRLFSLVNLRRGVFLAALRAFGAARFTLRGGTNWTSSRSARASLLRARPLLRLSSLSGGLPFARRRLQRRRFRRPRFRARRRARRDIGAG